MMTVVISEPWSLTLAWESILRRILADGEETSPRGMKTKELMHVDVHFDRPEEFVFVNDVRNANPVMHIAELAYFLNGREDDVLATVWLKGMEKYLNKETRLFDGGYGPSLARGLPFVFHELMRDGDSRRAVIPILRPDHVVRMSHTDDYPCNPLIGFNIRNWALNMWVVTRSQDVMQGYIYDQLEWRMLQVMMARATNHAVGSFDHHIVSCHLYQRDWEKAAACLGRSVPTRGFPEFAFRSVPDFWRYVRGFSPIIDGQVVNWSDDALHALYLYRDRKNLDWDALKEPLGLYSEWVRRWAGLNSRRTPDKVA